MRNSRLLGSIDRSARFGLLLGLSANLLFAAEENPLPGSLDQGFAPAFAGLGSAIVYSVAVQQDGKVVAGGDFTSVNGVPRECLTRLTVEGQLDPTFAATATADAPVRAVILQGDGKILVGGEFSRISGAAWNRIGRLEQNGGVDNSFNPGLGANGRVHCLDLGESGTVLLGGAFTKFDNVTRQGVARLNASGSLDTTFNANTDGTVYAIESLADGRVLIGGDFTKVNGSSAANLARLNSDGSLDTSFAGRPDFYVYAIALGANSDIYISGIFSRVNGSAHSGLARLKGTGAVDESFAANSSGAVYALLPQADGKLLVGGHFTTQNNVERNNVARLEANGSVDNSFDPGAGPNYIVRALTFQGGKIIVGGEFQTVNFLDHAGLARLNGDPAEPGTGLVATIWTAVEIGWNSKTNALYQVQWSTLQEGGVWLPLGSSVSGNGSTNSVFDTLRADSRRFYRVIELE